MIRFSLPYAAAVAAAAGGCFFVSPGHAQAPDPSAIWTLQDENSSITTGRLPDRFYTNGLRLGFTSGANSTPGVVVRLGEAIWGGGQTRISFDLVQQMYTPADTGATDPPLTDRPYAGTLTGTVGLWHDTTNTRDAIGLGLGIVGPSALASETQDGFHHLIGQARNRGWPTQLHDEPLFQLSAGRTWREELRDYHGFQTDVLPEATVGLGTLRIYAQIGVTVRLGQGLGSDFGVARIQPGPSGGDAFTPTRPLVWYVFAGMDGQAVAHDLTLQGNLWHDSRSVDLTPLVAEFQAGLAIIVHGVRLSYTQVMQTQEYTHQKGGPHQFGSLAVSARF